MKKSRPDLVDSLVSNPLPASFRVTPRSGDDVKLLAAQLRNPPMPGVEQVKDGEEVADRVLTVAKVISTTAGIATVILLVTSVLLIANTIRLSIFSRRREIEVMKLVGATNWFVRGPFMLEGLICGLIGSVVAVLLLLAGKEIVLPLLDIESGSSSAEAIAFGLNALVIICVGLAVGVDRLGPDDAPLPAGLARSRSRDGARRRTPLLQHCVARDLSLAALATLARCPDASSHVGRSGRAGPSATGGASPLRRSSASGGSVSSSRGGGRRPRRSSRTSARRTRGRRTMRSRS